MRLFTSTLALAATTAFAAPLLEERQSATTCGSNYYSSSQVRAAVNSGCNYVSQGGTACSGSYPHVYNNYEGFDFPVDGTYYEFPILESGQFTCQSPGADRVIFTADFQSPTLYYSKSTRSQTMAGEQTDPKTPSPMKSSRTATLDPIRTSGNGLDPTAAEFNLRLVDNDQFGAPDAGGSAYASDEFNQSDGAAQQANADPPANDNQGQPPVPSTPPTATSPRTPARSGRKSPFLGARGRVQSPTVSISRRTVAASLHGDDGDEDGPDPGARAAKRIESSNEAEAELYDKCVELQNEIAELKKANDQAKEDYIKLQQQNKTLEKNNEDFQKQILQHKEDDERKAEESKKKQRALGGKDLESEIETLQAELANALSDLNEKHDQVRKLQDANDELSAEKDGLHKQVDQLHELIETVQEEAKEHSEAQQALNNINSRFEFTFRGLGPGLTLPQYLDHVDDLQQTTRTRRDESRHSTASDFGEPQIGLQRQHTNRQVSGTSVADELTGMDESGSEGGDESVSEGDVDDGPQDDDPTLTAPADDAFKPFWEEDDNRSNSARTNNSSPSGSDSTDDPFAGIEEGANALLKDIGGIQGPITHSDEAPQPIRDPAVPGEAEKAGEDELFNGWEHKLVQTPAVVGTERVTDPLPTIAPLRAEIETLRAQIALQTQQAEDFATEKKVSQDETASLRAQIALQTHQAEEHTTESVRLGSELETLRAQIARQTHQAEAFKSEKEDLIGEKERLRRQVALHAPINRDRIAETESLQDDLKSLRARLATATAQLNRPPPPPKVLRPKNPTSWKEVWDLVPREVRRTMVVYAFLVLSLVGLVTALQVFEKYVWWWANTHHQLQLQQGGLGELWYSAMVQLTSSGGDGVGGLFGWLGWCVPWLWWDVLVGGLLGGG
ncbi:hypothetical protein KC330_g2167 [Hortaea werneckii]|nr:hypothetical protein KC330_g2167 [Hortaea werneckii]